MKKFAIVAAAIFAATLLSGLLPAQGHEKGEAAKNAKKGPLHMLCQRDRGYGVEGRVRINL